METEEREKVQQDPAVELLAHEAHVPTDDVAKLYSTELRKLAVGARITAFLPVIAFRHVREILRQRNEKKRVQKQGQQRG